MAPGRGERLIAVGEVVRSGRTLTIVKVGSLRRERWHARALRDGDPDADVSGGAERRARLMQFTDPLVRRASCAATSVSWPM